MEASREGGSGGYIRAAAERGGSGPTGRRRKAVLCFLIIVAGGFRQSVTPASYRDDVVSLAFARHECGRTGKCILRRAKVGLW